MSDSSGTTSAGLSMANLSEKVKQKLAESNNTKKGGGKQDKKSGKNDSATGAGESSKPKKDKKSKKGKEEEKGKKQPEVEAGAGADGEGEGDQENGGIQTEADLLKEIISLGGTKEDLDLIKDIDSGDESEMDFSAEGGSNDEMLNGDLSKYMKNMGFVSEDPPAKKKADDKTDKKEKKEKKQQKEKAKEQPKEKVTKSMPILETSFDTNKINHTGKAMLEPRADWYNHQFTLPSAPHTLSNATVMKLHTKSKELLDKENQVFHDGGKSKPNSQKKFLDKMLTGGTLSDKISALTLSIQESPLHSLRYLEQLVALCKKKSKTSAMQAIMALKDLFVNGVLPDRKLKWFKNQPLGDDVSNELLIVWAFEDWLKSYYFDLLQTLEVLSHDTVQYIRRNITNCIFDLLKAKPEQEVNLLRLGVNKLGDKDRFVASGVVQLLLRLQEAHPAMKSIVVDAISELIFRHGSDYHARYYGIITLNQTTLVTKDVALTNSLMKIYLTLFERLLSEWNKEKKTAEEETKTKKKPRWKNKGNKGKKGGVRQEAKSSQVAKEEEDSKMTNAILTGLVRAYPFSDLPQDTFDSHMNSLYRVTHAANFSTSLQALKLIYQIAKSKQNFTDRFYKTLYESLLDPRLAVTNRHLKDYMNLLFKCLKDDANQERLKAFSKRVVQMATSWLNIGVVSAVLFLLHELAKVQPQLRELFDEELKECTYDGRKRDPSFANAGTTKLWELVPLLSHFHPTVAVYAQGFLDQDETLAKPDLDLHTLNHFLDRFVYRNPKTKVTTRGGAIMQPLSGGESRQKPVSTVDWSNKKLEDVDVSERFFHQYFANRQQPLKQLKNDGGELNDDEVWKALVDSHPDLEGDGEEIDFDDEDLSDIGDEMSAGEGEEDQEDVDLDEADFDDEEGEDEQDEEQAEGEEDQEDEDEEDEEDQEDEDEFGGFDEDQADIVGSDDELQTDVPAGKRKASDDDSKSKNKKRRLKDLPEFASADDYAHLLGSDDDEIYD